MARIYLVRHGKAENGWGETSDPGLSDVGKIQAEAAARALEPLGPMPILASPLSRTRQTASPLEKIWGCKAEIDPRIAEIPSPSGVSTDRIQWLKRVMSEKWPNLDRALQSWRSNVIDAVCSISCDTVIVSHFVAINAAVGEAMEDDRVVVFRPDNASITVLETVDKALQLIKLGIQDETLVL